MMTKSSSAATANNAKGFSSLSDCAPEQYKALILLMLSSLLLLLFPLTLCKMYI
jgi:hypothetical protein